MGYFFFSIGPADSVYTLSFTVPHSGPSAVINFAGPLRGALDESWGMDNVTVDLVTDPSGTGPLAFDSPPGNFSALVRNAGGTFTRRLKNGTAIEYDAAGRMTAAIDRNGNTTSYGYDGNGLLTSVTDPAGRVTSFAHDGAGDLVSIADPDLSQRLFAYDGSHRLTTQTSERGFVTSYDYGPHGRLDQSNLPDGSINELAATLHLISLSCLRSGLGRAGVLQEPGLTSGGGDIGEVSGRRRGAPEGASPSLRPQRGAGLSQGKSARTRPMKAAPIRRRGFTARARARATARARRAGPATWATR